MFTYLAVTNNCTIRNAQFVNCLGGIRPGSGLLQLRNVLFATNGTCLDDLYGAPVDAENVTFANSSYLWSIYMSPPYSQVALTNCILANVSDVSSNISGSTLVGDYNGFYNSPAFDADQVPASSNPFQNAGGGNYYLANGGNFFNAGTDNIDPVLLSDLKQKTTYPPTLLSGSISVATNLYRQAPRDTENPGPDLGYHYDPLDYIASNVTLSATLTIAGGTALGLEGSYGLNPQNGGNVFSTSQPQR